MAERIKPAHYIIVRSTGNVAQRVPLTVTVSAEQRQVIEVGRSTISESDYVVNVQASP